nr:hypothetical protein [Aldersonia kunmingensis]
MDRNDDGVACEIDPRWYAMSLSRPRSRS